MAGEQQSLPWSRNGGDTFEVEPDLERHQDQIRIKYLEEDRNLTQVAQWLSDLTGFSVNKRQLTYRLGKWGYFKKASHKRPRSMLSTNRRTSRNRDVNELGIVANTQKDRDELGDREQEEAVEDCTWNQFATLSPQEMDVEVAQQLTAPDLTLSASLTSSRLTGWHSFKSVAKRCRTHTEERSDIRSRASLTSMENLDLFHYGSYDHTQCDHMDILPDYVAHSPDLDFMVVTQNEGDPWTCLRMDDIA